MIELFTRAEFEQALFDEHRRITKESGPLPIHPMGLVAGEYCYRLLISQQVSIVIRSSLDATGRAAATGEDSIRLIAECSDGTGWYAVGKGSDAYTTRVKGWQKRLGAKLEALVGTYGAVRGRLAIGERLRVVKKAGPTKGRLFASAADGGFRWMD